MAEPDQILQLNGWLVSSGTPRCILRAHWSTCSPASVPVAVTVASDCAVTSPPSLLANNNAPMSSAAKMVAARAR